MQSSGEGQAVPDQGISNAKASAPLLNPLGAHPVNAESSATSEQSEDASRRQPATSSTASAELARAKMTLKGSLRHFDDFPIKGIDFVDIMPLFMDPAVHQTLNDALDLQVKEAFSAKPDVVVGLDARGFLFGPGLALRLGTSFAPVRKKGKLPGPCSTATYEKEYGTDLFQMQEDAIKPGQKVLIVDDIIATGEFVFYYTTPSTFSLCPPTPRCAACAGLFANSQVGGSAKAAADLVKQLKGEIIGYLFILEIPGLNGKEKLGDIPTVIMLEDA